MEKTLLLTGGSSGIGKATVELFASRGWRVFELSRHGRSHGNIVHIDCDVCDEPGVQKAVEEVLQQTERLDVVISNAGYGISGAVEFTEMADAHHQFDVNFFGTLAVTKAVLPQLRKQQGGRIIYTSSVAAVLSIPYQSFYCASKAAINAFALALQNEVRSFGITVSVLMPGDVATGFTDARNKSDRGSEVYPHAQKAVETMEKDERAGMSPLAMARDFYRIATTANPAPQYVGGAQYKFFCFLDRVLPKRLVNRIVGALYQ
ncbi:MAG: SDR family oxidoreductase [Paludibacteraceae bacterium]|nr:SDR family oxidoreductase [Paludibacteraceae bacterium]